MAMSPNGLPVRHLVTESFQLAVKALIPTDLSLRALILQAGYQGTDPYQLAITALNPYELASGR